MKKKDYGIVFADNNGDEKILGGYAISEKLNEMIANNEIDQLKAGETFNINFSNNKIDSFELESLNQSKSIDNDFFDQKKEDFLNNYTSNDELSKIVIEQGGGFNGWIDSYQMGEWVESNHNTILNALKNDCDEFGIESVQELLDPTGKNFSDYSENEINAVIYQADRENDASLAVMTAIAYYAVEKVSSEYSMAKDEIDDKFKEPNQFDSISDFLKSSHEISSDQKNILNQLDNYLEKNDIQMNGITVEEDGRKKGEINVEINNMQKDENGNFKNDVIMRLNKDEVILSGGVNELDTAYKINSLNFETQFFSMSNNLDNQLRDKFEIQISNFEDSDIKKIQTFDKDQAVSQFSNIDNAHVAELFVNNEKVGQHVNDDGFHRVSVNSDHSFSDNISNWQDKEKAGTAELSFSLPEQDISKVSNEKQKDDGFSLG